MSAHVLLTGSTGNLGTYLLASLISSEQVCQVTCLNRSADAQSRQNVLLQERGLQRGYVESDDDAHHPKSVSDAGPVKITYHTCDFAKPRLNLPLETYDALTASVTHVLHCAWPVDWNKSFGSFEPFIRGASHLVDLVRSGQRKPLLFFISSSAVAGNWGSVPGGLSKVPEQEIDDWKVARFGYGQSKLVTERFLARAAQQYGIPVAICRVGQVSGPVNHGAHGAWPAQEWLPSLIASSKSMGMLPDSLGPINDVDWVPVDSLATIITELLFCARGKEPVCHHHVVNPKSTPWPDLLPAVRNAIGGQKVEVVSLPNWVTALQQVGEDLPANRLAQYPALKLLDFFDSLREKAVHLPKSRAPKLEVKNTIKRSQTLRNLSAVNSSWMDSWLGQWEFSKADTRPDVE